MRRPVAFALAAVLLVAPIVPVVAAGGAAGPATQDDGFLAQDQPEADNTVTRIALRSNGSAAWTIEFRTRLETDADVDEYRRFQSAFRDNTSRYLDPFRDRMTGVVAGADQATDREMNATGFAAETAIQEVPRRWGIVRYEFVWTGFAAVEGDRLVVGDVFGAGFYIGEDDALEVAVPDGYAVAEAAPTPDEHADGVVTWYGREDFGEERPRVVAAPADGTATEAGAGSDYGGDGAVPGTDDAVSAPSLALLALIVLVGLAVARRRGALADALAAVRNPLGEPDGPAAGDPDGSSGGGGAPSGDATGPAGSDASGDPDGATAGDADGAAGGAGGELLSDEDRVLTLLRERGGRVKQADVADALDWSASKTSRVLSRMADEGAVRKFRLGRENVVELPEGAD